MCSTSKDTFSSQEEKGEYSDFTLYDELCHLEAVPVKIVEIPTTSLIDCFALNPQNSLMLVQHRHRKFKHSDRCTKCIYTIEGDLVTSFGSKGQPRRSNTSLAIYTKDIIVCLTMSFGSLYDWYRAVSNQSFPFESELTLTCYNQDRIRQMKLSNHRYIFLACDDSYNIYTVSTEANAIAKYNSDLKFIRNLLLQGNLKDGIIVSICIRNDLLVVLAKYREEGIEEGSYSHAIHKFCLSTCEHTEKVLIQRTHLSCPKTIKLDHINNILVYQTDTYNAKVFSIFILYYSGKMVCISLPDQDCYNNTDQMELALTELYTYLSLCLVS